VIVYNSHLLNRLLTTAIGCKTPLEIWRGGDARDHGSLRVFGYSAYIDIKKDMFVFKVNKLVFQDTKKN